MKPSTKVMIGIGAGITLGGIAGYLIASSRYGMRAIKAVEEGDIRLPRPSYAVELPYSEEQFAILDELVCECADPLVRNVDETTTVDELTEAVKDCMATELYPDFDWPPVSGDHPTVSQLYAELGVLARKALMTNEICPAQVNPRTPW